MLRTVARLGSILLLAGTLQACAGAPTAEPGSAAPPTVIQVENHNALLVTVEAVSRGSSQRLGQVETGQSGTFPLPPTVDPFDLQILIDPVGSPERFLSETVSVGLGGLVEVRVEASLNLTSVSIR